MDVRRPALSVSVVLVVIVLAACGNEAGAPVSSGGGGGVPVRVRGSVSTTADGGWAVCPGGETECWAVDGPVPAPHDDASNVVVEGRLRGTRLFVEHEPTVDDGGVDFRNPCGDDVAAMAGENGDDATADGVVRYAESIADEYAGSWLARPGPVMVLAVTGHAARHRAALDAAGLDDVCVTDDGFRFTERELRAAQADVATHVDAWAARGWHFASSGEGVVENRVLVELDQLDPRLVHEVEERWHGMVAVQAAVEVLDGTVADLPDPPKGDFEIAVRPRGGVSMDALGHFVLRYDAVHDCVYLEGGTTRMKPVWHAGTRALRDPVRIVDGAGKVIATVDEPFEIGGGLAGHVEPGDPLGCGAADVWIT